MRSENRKTIPTDARTIVTALAVTFIAIGGPVCLGLLVGRSAGIIAGVVAIIGLVMLLALWRGWLLATPDRRQSILKDRLGGYAHMGKGSILWAYSLDTPQLVSKGWNQFQSYQAEISTLLYNATDAATMHYFKSGNTAKTERSQEHDPLAKMYDIRVQRLEHIISQLDDGTITIRENWQP